MIHLVIGGARSGKSRYAESLANLSDKKIIYVATATASDEEMRQRIAHHQQDRTINWQLIEEPFQLAEVIIKNNSIDNLIIVECMTLWLSNWLCNHNKESFVTEKQMLLTAVKTSQAELVIVSNEVGSGIVPLGELSRQFADEAGWLNQSLAEIANNVTLVIAGCPLKLKQNSSVVDGDTFNEKTFEIESDNGKSTDEN